MKKYTMDVRFEAHRYTVVSDPCDVFVERRTVKAADKDEAFTELQSGGYDVEFSYTEKEYEEAYSPFEENVLYEGSNAFKLNFDGEWESIKRGSK